MADFLKEHLLVQKLLILALFILPSEFGRTKLVFDILVTLTTLLTIVLILSLGTPVFEQYPRSRLRFKDL